MEAVKPNIYSIYRIVCRSGRLIAQIPMRTLQPLLGTEAVRVSAHHSSVVVSQQEVQALAMVQEVRMEV
jgi:hypothetical protein